MCSSLVVSWLACPLWPAPYRATPSSPILPCHRASLPEAQLLHRRAQHAVCNAVVRQCLNIMHHLPCTLRRLAVLRQLRDGSLAVKAYSNADKAQPGSQSLLTQQEGHRSQLGCQGLFTRRRSRLQAGGQSLWKHNRRCTDRGLAVKARSDAGGALVAAYAAAAKHRLSTSLYTFPSATFPSLPLLHPTLPTCGVAVQHRFTTASA